MHKHLPFQQVNHIRFSQLCNFRPQIEAIVALGILCDLDRDEYLVRLGACDGGGHRDFTIGRCAYGEGHRSPVEIGSPVRPEGGQICGPLIDGRQVCCRTGVDRVAEGEGGGAFEGYC